MHLCMKWDSLTFDWNQVRAFLVAAEEGSFSAAARALRLTQPTLGRQVAGLEEHLGVTLFEREGRTLSLTESGQELLAHVRAMGEAAELISLTASGQSQNIQGQVSITASDALACYHLPEILVGLRAFAPEIQIEVIATNEIQDLRRREADIAIRNVRPEQPDLIAKKVRNTTAHLCATTRYLDRAGRPTCLADFADHDFIGYLSYESMLTHLAASGLPLTRENFKILTNSGSAGWEMARKDLGVTFMSREFAETVPEIEILMPELFSLELPLWLVSHRELRTSRRIRLVFDYLADALTK